MPLNRAPAFAEAMAAKALICKHLRFCTLTVFTPPRLKSLWCGKLSKVPSRVLGTARCLRRVTRHPFMLAPRCHDITYRDLTLGVIRGTSMIPDRL